MSLSVHLRPIHIAQVDFPQKRLPVIRSFDKYVAQVEDIASLELSAPLTEQFSSGIPFIWI